MYERGVITFYEAKRPERMREMKRRKEKRLAKAKRSLFNFVNEQDDEEG